MSVRTIVGAFVLSAAMSTGSAVLLAQKPGELPASVGDLNAAHAGNE